MIEITIKVDEDIIIHVDPLYFEEMFTNVLENAILYNKENGLIIITAEKKKDAIKISVTDTGIGIEPDKKGLVFDEFYKVDESRHDFESSGLGLTIAKKIIELHGGTIQLDSKGKDEGTTVFFTLPLFSKDR
jgi:signal transduction histidine kinase